MTEVHFNFKGLWNVFIFCVGLIEITSCYYRHESTNITQNDSTTIKRIFPWDNNFPYFSASSANLFHSFYLVIVLIQSIKLSFTVTTVLAELLKTKNNYNADSQREPQSQSSSKIPRYYIVVKAVIFSFIMMVCLVMIPFFRRNSKADLTVKQLIQKSIHSSAAYLSDSVKNQKKRGRDKGTSQIEDDEFDMSLYSILELISIHSYETTHRITLPLIQMRLIQIIKQVSVSIVRRPLSFYRRIKKVTKLLRWTTFISKVLWTLNKSISHVKDGISMTKQYIRSVKAKRSWSSILQDAAKKQKFEYYVKLIQKRFRGYQARKARRNLLLNASKQAQNNGNNSEIMDVVYNNNHQKHLQKLKLANDAHKEINDYELNRKEKRTITQQDKKQLHLYVSSLIKNRCFLLKPNTKFSIFWRYNTTLCFAFELFYIILTPLVTEQMKRINLYDYFIYKNEFQKYICIKQESTNWFHDIASFIRGRKEYSNDRCFDMRWNMTVTWIFFHVYQKVVPFIAWVSFLDVIVTFYIGKIDPENGMLKPKPFIERFLIPGIVLQLLVNPSMHRCYSILKSFLVFSIENGILRILYSCLMMTPTLVLISDFLLYRLYMIWEDDYTDLIFRFESLTVENGK